MKGNYFGGLIDSPFHIARYGCVHSFILVKKEVQDMIVIVLYGVIGFFYASVVTLLTIKIDVVMGNKVVKVPGKRSILLYGA
jgi:hypothetical protein